MADRPRGIMIQLFILEIILVWRNTKLTRLDIMQRKEMMVRMVVSSDRMQSKVNIQGSKEKLLWNQKTGKWRLGRSFNISSPSCLSSLTFSCSAITTFRVEIIK